LLNILLVNCVPCTFTVQPNQHESAGHWWLESGSKKDYMREIYTGKCQ